MNNELTKYYYYYLVGILLFIKKLIYYVSVLLIRLICIFIIIYFYFFINTHNYNRGYVYIRISKSYTTDINDKTVTRISYYW